MLLDIGLFQPFPSGSLGIHRIYLALGGYDKLHHISQDGDKQELYTFDQVFSAVKNEKSV